MKQGSDKAMSIEIFFVAKEDGQEYMRVKITNQKSPQISILAGLAYIFAVNLFDIKNDEDEKIENIVRDMQMQSLPVYVGLLNGDEELQNQLREVFSSAIQKSPQASYRVLNYNGVEIWYAEGSRSYRAPASPHVKITKDLSEKEDNVDYYTIISGEVKNKDPEMTDIIKFLLERKCECLKELNNIFSRKPINEGYCEKFLEESKEKKLVELMENRQDLENLRREEEELEEMLIV